MIHALGWAAITAWVALYLWSNKRATARAERARRVREEAELDLWELGGDGASIEDWYFELGLDFAPMP